MNSNTINAIARAVKKTRDIDGIQRSLLTDNIAYELSLIDSKFDREKFLTDCQPEPKPITLSEE